MSSLCYRGEQQGPSWEYTYCLIWRRVTKGQH